MTLHASERERSPDLVFRYLQDRIVSGDLKPGERIDLDQVSEDVGVSRTPVREALMRLEADGMVDRKPYRGAIVRGVDTSTVAEVYGLRLHLEGLAARLAVERLTDEDVAEMQRHHAQLLATMGGDEPHRSFNEHNAAFHDVLYRAAGVETVRGYLTALNRQSERIRMHVDLRGNSTVHDEHSAIIEACHHRDGQALEAAVRHHILHACVLFLTRVSTTDTVPAVLRAVLSDAEAATVRIGLSVAAANRSVVDGGLAPAAGPSDPNGRPGRRKEKRNR